MVLVGKVNREIVSAINVHGPLAVGLSGEDANLITAGPRSAALGFVGDVLHVDPTILQRLLAQGLIPVVATIGADKAGQAYNINADTVAGAVAAALGAEKLVFLTDVEGLRADADDPATLLPPGDGGRARRDGGLGRGCRRDGRPRWRPAAAPCGPGWPGPTSSTAGCPTPCCSSCSPTAGSAPWWSRDARPAAPLMHTYAEPPVTFVRGEGSYLFDDEGRRYLDFISRAGRHLARPRPPGGGRGRGRAGPHALPRLQPLRQRVGARGGRHPRPAHRRRAGAGRRPGVLRQLGGRGQRVRPQAGPPVGRAAAATWWSAPGAPSTAGRWPPCRHRPAGQARAVRAAARGLRPRALRRPRRPGRGLRPGHAWPPCCSSRSRARAG